MSGRGSDVVFSKRLTCSQQLDPTSVHRTRVMGCDLRLPFTEHFLRLLLSFLFRLPTVSFLPDSEPSRSWDIKTPPVRRGIWRGGHPTGKKGISLKWRAKRCACKQTLSNSWPQQTQQKNKKIGTSVPGGSRVSRGWNMNFLKHCEST